MKKFVGVAVGFLGGEYSKLDNSRLDCVCL